MTRPYLDASGCNNKGRNVSLVNRIKDGAKAMTVPLGFGDSLDEAVEAVKGLNTGCKVFAELTQAASEADARCDTPAKRAGVVRRQKDLCIERISKAGGGRRAARAGAIAAFLGFCTNKNWKVPVSFKPIPCNLFLLQYYL